MLTGTKRAEHPSGPGTRSAGEALASIGLHSLHQGTASERLQALLPVFHLTDPDVSLDTLTQGDSALIDDEYLRRLLYEALDQLPVTGRLINLTSGALAEEDLERDKSRNRTSARDIKKLGARLFPTIETGTAHKATNALVELASMAKRSSKDAPILAARVHAFFRGLPGLWACADTECSLIAKSTSDDDYAPSPTGALYAQPHRTCECGARAFELHTCRSCGSAYFKAYAFDPNKPDYLWPEDVGEADDAEGVVEPIYLSLEEPPTGSARLDYLEPVSGRLGSQSDKAREVWLPMLGQKDTPEGEFQSCVRCGAKGRDSMDHVTKGDEPFQELVSSQLLEQPPNFQVNTPLKGRKALIFSDGRQASSRLAGKLQQYSMRDAVRPLFLSGLEHLESQFDRPITLSHAYAVLLSGCVKHDVKLRPPQAKYFEKDMDSVRKLMELSPPGSWDNFAKLSSHINEGRINKSLMSALYPVLKDRYTGLNALGLATISAVIDRLDEDEFNALPVPPGAEDFSDDVRRRALLDLWLHHAIQRNAICLPTTPLDWIDASGDQTEGESQSRQRGVP